MNNLEANFVLMKPIHHLLKGIQSNEYNCVHAKQSCFPTKDPSNLLIYRKKFKSEIKKLRWASM